MNEVNRSDALSDRAQERADRLVNNITDITMGQIEGILTDYLAVDADYQGCDSVIDEVRHLVEASVETARQMAHTEGRYEALIESAKEAHGESWRRAFAMPDDDDDDRTAED